MADLNEKLFDACKIGDTERAQLLVTRGANIQSIDTKKHTPVQWAAELGHTTTTLMLMESAGNARPFYGMVALLAAALGGQCETVNALLFGGISVNVADSHGHTALHIAAEFGQTAMVVLLVQNGANIGAVAHKFRGEMPLHICSGKGLTETAMALVKLGAHIEAKDRRGATALHYASQFGHASTVAALLDEADADIHAVDTNGWTALHFSAREGHVDVVKLLISRGADTNSKDFVLKRTPLQHASTFAHSETMFVLMQNGASSERLKTQKYVLLK